MLRKLIPLILCGSVIGGVFATDAHAQEMPPEQAWTLAVEQVAAEHGVDLATANQRLANFLIWHLAVTEIAARDGVSFAQADRMLLRFLTSLHAPAPAVGGDTVWDRLAQCESGGNWSINTGNGYYGGLQFLPSTWRANGGSGLPHQNSREEQIRVAENLRAVAGFAPWPGCSRKLGLR